MKKLIKKTIIACLMFTAAMAANAQVEVNETNFPDGYFRDYILEQYGNELTVAEIATTTEIDVSGRNIGDLKGIEHFTALKKLDCQINALTSLDVSELTELQVLDCRVNSLTSLAVAGLTNLQYLNCYSNQLSSLDISKLTNLQELYCHSNQLTTLDVSKLANLRRLDCSHNQLSSLDVSGLANLQYLDCYHNQLTSLELSALTNLQVLYCYNNQLSSLDVSELKNLYTLFCQENQLSSLDVSGLTNLYTLFCYNNQLSSLDVSGLTNLQYLSCSFQSLTLTLMGTEGNYSKEIELNNPTETVFAAGIRYENNKLISTNSGIGSTPFEVVVAGWNGWNDKMSGEITLLYNNTNNISAIENANANIKIYPNPVKDELHIESGDLKIESVEILDLTGKKLLTFNSQLSAHSIHVSALPQGIYFVKLETDKGIVTQKIIKE
jgi:Leucine-rich repeat (LRR) protein